MKKFCVADASMLDMLIQMTKICFEETDRSVKFFFNRKVDLNNCVVCIEDGKPVAQLHMLPVGIRNGREIIPAHYVYAASTLPEYRKQGCMTGLVDYACKLADSRGQKFSVLAPATEELFKFYRKLGYYRFHKYREVILTNEEMSKFHSDSENINMDCEDIQKIRGDFFSADGELVWDNDSLKYEFDMNRNLNGDNIFCENGYAISMCSYKHIVKVHEMAYTNGNIETLLGKIYNRYGERKEYILSMPVRNKFFGNNGKIIDKSMIRPVCNCEKKKLMNFIMNTAKNNPCIGFTFE